MLTAETIADLDDSGNKLTDPSFHEGQCWLPTVEATREKYFVLWYLRWVYTEIEAHRPAFDSRILLEKQGCEQVVLANSGQNLRNSNRIKLTLFSCACICGCQPK